MILRVVYAMNYKLSFDLIIVLMYYIKNTDGQFGTILPLREQKSKLGIYGNLSVISASLAGAFFMGNMPKIRRRDKQQEDRYSDFEMTRMRIRSALLRLLYWQRHGQF